MICPGGDWSWFICFRHKTGVLPIYSTGNIHEESAWAALLDGDTPSTQRTKEDCLKAGFFALRLRATIIPGQHIPDYIEPPAAVQEEEEEDECPTSKSPETTAPETSAGSTTTNDPVTPTSAATSPLSSSPR